MAMSINFVPGTQPPPDAAPLSWWFPFIGRQLLLSIAPKIMPIRHISLSSLGLKPVRSSYLGLLEGHPCYAVELPPETPTPPQTVLKGLRELYGVIDNALLDLGGLAFQILEWDRNHQFCGRCGTPTISYSTERTRRCPTCQLSQYPRISPAMIVLIQRQEKLLLGRAHRFRPGMYSLLAGYVESHESLEACVIREVREEVGLEIADIRYWGSQPWPFPHTLMVGFTAQYLGGDIIIDPDELVDARWFSIHELPELPGGMSIARKMIDWFVAEIGQKGQI